MAPTSTTLKDQLEDAKRQTYAATVVELFQKNSHKTLSELSSEIGEDDEAVNILMSTPLRDLVGDCAADESLEGREVNAKRSKAWAKKTAKRVTKKAPKRVSKKTAKKRPTLKAGITLAQFLKGAEKGWKFKAKAYAEAAGITQQTAINHLNKSSKVKLTGQKRGSMWVVQ